MYRNNTEHVVSRRTRQSVRAARTGGGDAVVYSIVC